MARWEGRRQVSLVHSVSLCNYHVISGGEMERSMSPKIIPFMLSKAVAAAN